MVGLERRVMSTFSENVHFNSWCLMNIIRLKTIVKTWYYLFLISNNYTNDVSLNKYDAFDIFSRLFLSCLMTCVNSMRIALKRLRFWMLIVRVMYRHIHISKQNFKKSGSNCLYRCNKTCVFKYYMVRRTDISVLFSNIFLNSEF